MASWMGPRASDRRLCSSAKSFSRSLGETMSVDGLDGGARSRRPTRRLLWRAQPLVVRGLAPFDPLEASRDPPRRSPRLGDDGASSEAPFFGDWLVWCVSGYPVRALYCSTCLRSVAAAGLRADASKASAVLSCWETPPERGATAEKHSRLSSIDCSLASPPAHPQSYIYRRGGEAGCLSLQTSSSRSSSTT